MGAAVVAAAGRVERSCRACPGSERCAWGSTLLGCCCGRRQRRRRWQGRRRWRRAPCCTWGRWRERGAWQLRGQGPASGLQELVGDGHVQVRQRLQLQPPMTVPAERVGARQAVGPLWGCSFEWSAAAMMRSSMKLRKASMLRSYFMIIDCFIFILFGCAIFFSVKCFCCLLVCICPPCPLLQGNILNFF